MGWFSKADGQAFEPTRGGMQPMTDAKGRPIRLSELTKEQRRGTGQGVKPQKRPKNKDKFWK